MSKIFMIIGKSLSGKDTLLNNILSDKEFCERNNLKRLVRYTTRKPRPGEVDGETYHFITDEEYESRFEHEAEPIVSSFCTEFGIWHYITDVSSLDEDTNYIMVGDPTTLIFHKLKLDKDKLCVIYLMPPDWLLMKRFGNRDDNEEYSEKKYQEIHRRFIDDFLEYGQKVNMFINNCNCIFNVSDDYSLSEIERLMELYLTGFSKCAGIILDKSGNGVMFDNSYIPEKEKSSSLYDAMKGAIYICNGDFLINTEQSLCIHLGGLRHTTQFSRSTFFDKE